MQKRSPEQCKRKIGFAQFSANQVGFFEIGRLHHRAIQLGLIEHRRPQAGLPQIRLTQICLGEIGIAQVRLPQARLRDGLPRYPLDDADDRAGPINHRSYSQIDLNSPAVFGHARRFHAARASGA